MKLKPKSVPSGYMVRKTPEDSEHGPFTLENLRDLAEFGNLGPDSLVRPETADDYVALRETPELLREVFPERTRMKLGQWQGDKATEDGYRPVEVRGIRECEPGSVADDTGPLHPRPERSAGEGAGGLRLRKDGSATGNAAASGTEDTPPAFQTQLEMGELGRLLKEANEKNAPGLEPDVPSAGSRIGFAARWAAMAFLVAFGVKVWLDINPASMSAFDFILNFLIGVILFALGFVFILPEAMRVIAAPFGAFADALILGGARETRKPDHTTAERFLEAGNRDEALREYRHLIARFPRDIPSYLKAIRLCREMGREKEARKLYEKALRHIRGKQDRNLFIGSVRRMDEARTER